MKTAATTVVAALLAAAALGQSCSINPFPQLVATNQLLPFTITPPEFEGCGGNGIQVSVAAAPSEGTLMATGAQLLYQAPAYETDDVASLVISCPATGASCDLLVGFLVSAPATTVPPTTRVPTTLDPMATTTQAPTTTVLPQCPAEFTIETKVALNGVFNTAFPAALPASLCPGGITTYRSDSNNAKGRVYVNLIGSVLIVGSQFETLDTFAVTASCDAIRTCTIPVRVVSFLPLTQPPTSTIAPPPAACPNIYYYESPIGGVYSSSLRDMPGQSTCAFGRAFTLLSSPTAGSLNLGLNGDFTYTPPSSEGWAEFTFAINCMGAVQCLGTARMLVTRSITLIPVTTKLTEIPQVPFVSDGFTTCQGTCNEQAWKTLPGASLVWDSNPAAVGNVAMPRKDGRAMGAISVDFVNGSLILSGYSQVGSLAARFLTFEPVTDFNTGKGNGLASFKAECLANQPVATGISEEVWKWTSLSNKTGHVGLRYNSGSSYYHKFGGKHIGCDTFAANPCRYAPLLTPSSKHWKVDVSSCDVTWTGTFNVSSLLAMRDSNKGSVFYYTSSKDVEGQVYSQAITPRSWLERIISERRCGMRRF